MIVKGQSQKKLIEVLFDEGKVQSDIAVRYKNLSNLEAENKLKSEQMFSSEDIARGYAALYDLPYVGLAAQRIPRDTLETIPEALARQYKIIAYKIEKTERDKQPTISIAVAEPAKLAVNLQGVLSELEQKKGFKIELAITGLDDFMTVVNQYKIADRGRSPAGSVPSAVPSAVPFAPPAKKAEAPVSFAQPSYKTIDLDKISIPYEVITKFPEDIARKYEMVVFEAPHPSFIKVAVVEPEDRKIREILDFVQTKNDIVIEEYKVTPGEIERAMRFYKPQPLGPPPMPKVPPPAEPVKPPPPPSPPEEKKLEEIKESEEEAEEEAKQEVRQKEEEKIEEKKEEIPEVKGPEKAQVLVSKEDDLDKFLGQTVRDVRELEGLAQTGNVPRIVAAMIILAVSKKASDIHIEPSEKNIRLRFRIDGLLRDVIKLPLEIHPAIISRVKILSKLKIDETRIPQDGRFDCIATGHAIDLRISTLPTVHGEKIAMRILDKSAHLYTLEELGLAGRGLKVLIENMNKPYGVILATGPTGSGKTTTLYAILNRISNASVNIITLEDPVEYEVAGINQCQIKPKIGFTFANGLRSIIRQDPNIIMVGEIRDSETAALATHAALTGHLMLSTLHTNDAAGALPRLVDMGVEPFFITSLINAIIAQRLVRKLCPKCKRRAHIPVPIFREIERELEKFNLPKPYQFFEGTGCDECELGYKGRIGIFEVLTMSGQLENLVLEHKPTSEIKKQAIADGMVTIKQDGLFKALKGQTTVSEVLRVITV